MLSLGYLAYLECKKLNALVEFAMQMTATKVASDQMFLSKDKVQSSMMNFISHFDH